MENKGNGKEVLGSIPSTGYQSKPAESLDSALPQGGAKPSACQPRDKAAAPAYSATFNCVCGHPVAQHRTTAGWRRWHCMTEGCACERLPSEQALPALCTCTHPQGWHYRGVGTCLDCSCCSFTAPPPRTRGDARTATTVDDAAGVVARELPAEEAGPHSLGGDPSSGPPSVTRCSCDEALELRRVLKEIAAEIHDIARECDAMVADITATLVSR